MVRPFCAFQTALFQQGQLMFTARGPLKEGAPVFVRVKMKETITRPATSALLHSVRLRSLMYCLSSALAPREWTMLLHAQNHRVILTQDVSGARTPGVLMSRRDTRQGPQE